MAYIQSNIVICSSNVLTSNTYVKSIHKPIICSLQVLTFTPDSSLSPPHQDDSEDESSFMTHTQVDLRHDGDLDLQHDGVGEGDLDQNFDILSSRSAPGGCDGSSNKAGEPNCLKAPSSIQSQRLFAHSV